MSHETSQSSGLVPGERDEASALRHDAHIQRFAAEMKAEQPIDWDLSKGPIYALGHLIARPLEKRSATRKANKEADKAEQVAYQHYQAHEAEYRAQAKAEMAADEESKKEKAA